MSVAPEFAPEVYIPARARRGVLPNHLSLVPSDVPGEQDTLATLPLAAPRDPRPVATDWSVPRVVVAAPTARPAARPVRRPSSSGVRLTRRGMAVVALGVAALAGILIGIAALSAPTGAAAPSAGTAPRVVTVHAGDTLWSIASRVAPGADPRDEVAHLQQLNHLAGVALRPGQQLRTR